LKNDVKEVRKAFYRLYSNPVLCDNDILKPMQKKIAKFRNEMAIDFYNLTKKDVPEFAKKYLPDGAELFLDIPIDDYLINRLGQSGFKRILDKILSGESVGEWLGSLTKNLLGFIQEDWDQEKQRYHLVVVRPENISQILRATCEFLYLLSNDEVEVGRCGAEGCNRLFIPAVRGKAQLFCNNACRVREYRRKKKLEGIIL